MARVLSWIAYFAFAAIAFWQGWHDNLLTFDGAAGFAKAALWAGYFGFLAFSLYCSARENLFASLGGVGKYWWGRQIGLDLYISAALSLFAICLVTGSWTEAALWTLPILAFVNLAFLPFVLINFERILALFD